MTSYIFQMNPCLAFLFVAVSAAAPSYVGQICPHNNTLISVQRYISLAFRYGFEQEDPSFAKCKKKTGIKVFGLAELTEAMPDDSRFVKATDCKHFIDNGKGDSFDGLNFGVDLFVSESQIVELLEGWEEKGKLSLTLKAEQWTTLGAAINKNYALFDSIHLSWPMNGTTKSITDALKKNIPKNKVYMVVKKEPGFLKVTDYADLKMILPNLSYAVDGEFKAASEHYIRAYPTH